jgi:hypothetical protein
VLIVGANKSAVRRADFTGITEIKISEAQNCLCD